MSDERSRVGIKKCGEWLAYCLKLGWRKDQLDDLEALWWKYRDRNGNLIESAPPSPDRKPCEHPNHFVTFGRITGERHSFCRDCDAVDFLWGDGNASKEAEDKL